MQATKMQAAKNIRTKRTPARFPTYVSGVRQLFVAR